MLLLHVSLAPISFPLLQPYWLSVLPWLASRNQATTSGCVDWSKPLADEEERGSGKEGERRGEKGEEPKEKTKQIIENVLNFTNDFI